MRRWRWSELRHSAQCSPRKERKKKEFSWQRCLKTRLVSIYPTRRSNEVFLSTNTAFFRLPEAHSQSARGTLWQEM